MNKENYFCTFKYFDRRGRRLSIFGTTRPGVDSTETTCGLSIYVVTCSLEDRFNKRDVRKAFEYGQHYGTFENSGITPSIVAMPCEDGNSRTVFIQYCERNFYRMKCSQVYGTNIGLQFDTLIRRSMDDKPAEYIILPSTVHQIKAIPYEPTILEEDSLDEVYKPDDTIDSFSLLAQAFFKGDI